MPSIFDILYREFCRARLAEMRKQLWSCNSVAPAKSCENCYRDEASDRGAGLEFLAGMARRHGKQVATNDARLSGLFASCS